MKQDIEEVRKDFEKGMAMIQTVCEHAMHEEMNPLTFMACISITLARMGQALQMSKEELKDHVIRDIEVIYLSEAAFNKEKLQ